MKVLFIGHWKEGATGWAKAAQQYVLAMDSVGIDVIPRAIKLSNTNPEIPERIKELESKSSMGCDICIQHVLPHHLDFNGRFKKNIALCVYESSNAELSNWQAKINTMDELWTCSKFSKHAFQSMGVGVPIKIVPHTFDMSIYDKQYNKLDNPEFYGNYIFYTIADLNRRKNLSALIKAFHLAFTPNEPVRLLIKTGRYGVSPQDCAGQVLDDCKKIKESLKLHRRTEDYSSEIVITNTLTDEEIMQVHTTGDCFVSTSHGEAWCIPLFDAVNIGKETIAPDNMFDFYNGKTVATHIEPVFGMNDTFFELGSGHEYWHSVDVLDLKAKMRQVFDGRNTKHDTVQPLDSYNYQTIGNMIKGLL